MDGHEQVGLTKSNATFLSGRLLGQGAGDWGLQAKRAILPQVPLMMMPPPRGPNSGEVSGGGGSAARRLWGIISTMPKCHSQGGKSKPW